jgi:hypothetical protein
MPHASGHEDNRHRSHRMAIMKTMFDSMLRDL